MDGILLIDKPAGMTTRDIDNRLKYVFSTKKVGHAGTLDPFATGLVLIGLNQGTKALSLFEFLDKTYVAKLKLGAMTKSGDKDTEVIQEAPVPHLTREAIDEACSKLVGEQLQVPPMYSALKIDGTPLYKLARQDIEIVREPRKVTIFDIKVIEYSQEEQTIIFEAHVSKGTYIRTLGEDLAKVLNTLGYLIELRRTKIGRFPISKAVPFDEVTECSKVYSIPSGCYFIPKVPVDGETQKKIKNGIPIKVKTTKDLILFVDKEDINKALAFYMRDEGDVFKCRRGME